MLNLSKPAGELLSDVSVMTSDTTTIGRGAYLITQFHVIVRYLQLLVLPYGQNLDHTIPLSTSLLEPLPLLSLLLLLGVLAGAVVLWRRGEPGTQTPMAGLCRLAAFGIFWFFIALSVESSIVPIRDLMFEHRVYLPSVGFFLSVVSLVGLATGRFGRKLPWLWTGAPFGLAVVALLSVGTTVARNRVWLDGITLWSDVRDKSPGKYRAYSMLGTYYVEEGRTQEALAVLETAVRLNPKAYDSLFNLAQVYGWLGRNQEAEEVLATLKREAPERFREFETVYRSQFAFPGTAR
jgi:tetratricopeptide (TPR) repeat protein